MTEFLNAVKADLLDRRILPIVVLVGVALAAALGYAVIGGGSSSSTPAVAISPAPVTPGASGIAVSQADTETAVAETTNGASDQRGGSAHDPFKALPNASAETSGTVAASTPAGLGGSGSTSPAGSESGSSTNTGGSGSETKSKTTKPTKKQTVYHVAVLFGVVPAGTAPEDARLTPHENLKLLTALPSVKQPLIVFRGVTTGGKSATFTLVGEAILHGNAACLPNAAQCQAIDLKPGQSEQLEYLQLAGETVTYELRVVSIASSKASSSQVKGMLNGQSKAVRKLLRRSGLSDIPFLHRSGQYGVLAFAGHKAFGASAHSARRAARRGR